MIYRIISQPCLVPVLRKKGNYNFSGKTVFGKAMVVEDC